MKNKPMSVANHTTNEKPVSAASLDFWKALHASFKVKPEPKEKNRKKVSK
jgi:hypothetical protein